jgi:poly(3-hydroxybutyrate) depolymerase
VQEGVGHYGVFNGTRWRTEIQPRIREFIRTIEYGRGAIPDGRTARRLQHPELAVSPV